MLEPTRSVRNTSERPTCERILYAWPTVQVGAFDCLPDDARWRRENCVEEGHIIAFPGRSVEIAQYGDRPRVMDPNRVVFYNRSQTYRRALLSRDGDGDHCTYLVVAPELLEEIAHHGSGAQGGTDRRPFPAPCARCGAAEYLEIHAIRRQLASAEPIEIQERLVRLVERVVRALSEQRPAPNRARLRTRRAREELAEAARAVLARDLHRRLSLDEVAGELRVSVFHLSRVFREAAGMGLHGFRDQLRLRSSLAHVLGGEAPLTHLALDAGYASSSHFTDRFRALFGSAPSRLRAAVTAGRAF
jgi:AraC family transcriptional regulator